MNNLIFVDCEARGASPVRGTMTEFGAVHYKSRESFHGKMFNVTPDPKNPAIPVVGDRLKTDKEMAEAFSKWIKKVTKGGRAIFVSDNPAYDWQWISALFAYAEIENPFGHSARRISDFYAGLMNDWNDSQGWKKYRVTTHDHNPVHDSLGNVEAFKHLMDSI